MSTHPIPLCPACHCVMAGPPAHNPHSFNCPEQTREQILKRLTHAHASALERLNRIWDLNKEVARWQGKFNTLRLENNALRRRLRKQEAPAPEPQWHNPERIKLSLGETEKGWRFLLKDEMTIPPDGQVFLRKSGVWADSCLQGLERDLGSSYRTRTPLPK